MGGELAVRLPEKCAPPLPTPPPTHTNTPNTNTPNTNTPHTKTPNANTPNTKTAKQGGKHNRSHRSTLLTTALIACLVALPSHATDVAGIISTDTTWTPIGSPYIVTGELSIAPDTILTILPGAEVQLHDDVDIVVSGSLLAIGSAVSPIRIGKYTPHTKGGGIVFDGADHSLSVTGRFVHCHITDLSGESGAIRGSFAVLEILSCTISNFSSKAIRPVDSQVAIRGTIVHDTLESVNTVRCRGVIDSNHIYNVEGNADAVDIDFGWEGPGDGTMRVEWNLIEGGPHSNADGIDFGTSRDALCQYNIIRYFGDKGMSVGEESEVIARNNLIYACTLGIAVKDSSTPIIENHTIHGCGIGIDNYQKRSGRGGGRGVITNSIIWDCDTSIRLRDGSTLDVGYCIVQGDTVWPGPGNMNSDPQLADPAGTDFRLLPGSPALHTGTHLTWAATAVDLDAEPRISGAAIDRGAYEFRPGPLAANLIGTPLVGEAPFEVVFTAHTGGTNQLGLVYRWDFENDGTNDVQSSGAVTVTNSYTTFGRKSIALTVSNNIGEVATATRANYVAVLTPPILYVSLDGGHVAPFASWADAATNIHSALDLAFDGTEVLVSNGTFHLPAELSVLEAATLRSAFGAAATILDGGATNRCLSVDNSSAIVQGFTITRGSAFNGAGIHLNRGRLEDCVVVDNHAANDGGGLYIGSGGLVVSTVVTNNSAVDDGGGMLLLGNGQEHHCRIVDYATTADKGGGAFCDGGGILRNCLVAGNQAADSGGGIYGLGGGFVESCTITANTSGDDGGGIRCAGGVSVLNSIVYFNDAVSGDNRANAGVNTYRHTCTTPAVVGSGNISQNPQFMSSSHPILKSDSPCQGAGLNQGWMTGAVDLNGRDRIIATIVDMGAFELTSLGCHFTADTTTAFVPAQTVFSATIGGTNTTGVYYRWDFENDGTIDSSGLDVSVVTNTFTTAGLYSVSLMVSNAIGEVTTCLREDLISATPTILYVATNGNHISPFATWQDAATNIQDAVDAAAGGTKVFVSNGLYRVNASVNLGKNVTLRGVNGSRFTTIDGGGSSRCLWVFASGAVADGFTIANGRQTQGAGALISGSGTIRDCIFSNNVSDARGAGVFLSGGGLVVDCLLVDNRSIGAGSSADGGAAYLTGGTVARSTFIHNTASDDGGALEASGGIVARCTFMMNTAGDKGGAVLLRAGAIVQSCVAVSNSATFGGAYADAAGGGVLENCTLAFNHATDDGGGLYPQGGGITRNCIVMFNTSPEGDNTRIVPVSHTYEFCNISPAVVGSGIITSDPKFLDVGTHDYRLQPTSPSIDAGTNSVTAEDFQGLPRPLDGDNSGTATTDIGAHEYMNAAADSDNDGQPDGWEWDNGLDPTVNDAGDDADGDNADNRSEFVAGTDPNNAAENLRITTLTRGDDALLSWSTVVGRAYAVLRTTNLAGTWTNVYAVPGDGTLMSYTNNHPPSPTLFFRVDADLP